MVKRIPYASFGGRSLMETSSDTSVTAASTVAALGGGGMGKVTST